MGYIPKAVESLFITNSDIHKYNIRNKDKMRSAYGKHEFMNSNFRFVGIHIWNYILDHLDVNVTLPKLKKNTFKTHILADNCTYIVSSYLSIRHLFLHHLFITHFYSTLYIIYKLFELYLSV